VSSPAPPETVRLDAEWAVLFWMYGLGEGSEENVDSGRPKDLARMDLGVRESQSARLKVVLCGVSNHERQQVLGGWE
jgi:hypothetical protein